MLPHILFPFFSQWRRAKDSPRIISATKLIIMNKINLDFLVNPNLKDGLNLNHDMCHIFLLKEYYFQLT